MCIRDSNTVAQDDTTDRFSFKIDFDHYITGQTWLGLDKIVLNNMMGDASYMKEYLSYDIMDYVGVDSPLYALSLIHISEPTRLGMISYAVFCLKKKKTI